MASVSLTAQQDRSRKTADKLLLAAIQVLEQGGLEACTVPAVAAAAGFSAASLYRRFEDKDALLRAAFLQVLQPSGVLSQKALEAQFLRATLEETAARVIGGLLQHARARPPLWRGLVRYLQEHPGADFAREVTGLQAAEMQRMANLLLHHGDRVRHPEPKRAALFAVLAAASRIEAAVLAPHSLWHAAMPLSDKQFSAELTRMLVAYLRRKP